MEPQHSKDRAGTLERHANGMLGVLDPGEQPPSQLDTSVCTGPEHVTLRG
jgi:hypothetical protein